MIKANLKILIITSVVILLPILVGVMLWDQLPQEIPIHWNMAGEVDGWGGKPFVVFGVPLLLLVLHWMTTLITLADPKKQNHSDKIRLLIFWLIPTMSIVLSAVTYATAMGEKVLVERILPVFMGLLFVIIGNYLPKCKQNYTIGIKIPWTLENEENWNKTHRVAGWVWVIGGIAVMVAGFFGILWFIVPVLFITALVPIIYSYLLHRKGVCKEKEDKKNG